MRIALSVRFFGIAGSLALAGLSACGGGSNGDARGGGTTNGGASAGSGSSGVDSGAGDASTGGAGIPGPAIPIVAGGSAAVPYQFGPNTFGITGSAFFAKSAQGSSTVMLDSSQASKICLTGTVDVVPTPADGGHPPYSDYWGIDLGFNLDQPVSGADASDASKTPWAVPANVVGFWFTVEGPTIPGLRFKTTPTGKDPALEQDSCALVTPSSGVPQPVLFTDMFVQCWDGPQGTAPTDISMGLVDVSLQVAADVDAPQPVDFCLTAFGVLTQ